MDPKIKVVLVSNETIKPSSPTPHHLRNFNFSLIDQFSSPIYIPIILFYDQVMDSNIDDEDRSNRLKRSLSETLTRFYPVAGRINGNVSIDCNDEGVDYFETRIQGKMSDFMVRPELHNHLLPSHIVSNTFAKDAQLAVQVNLFDCGGLAICFCMSHKIADASSMTTFINDWAATTRGSIAESVGPIFESASLFPARDILKTSIEPVPDTAGVDVVTKRFVFDASMIAALRAKIQGTTVTSVGKYPTRVEAVSGLIWKSTIEMSKVKLESGSSTKPLKAMVVHHSVNLRKRMDPPLNDVSFGNIITLTSAVASSFMIMSQEVELEELVGKLRAAISRINISDYINKMLGCDDDEEEFVRLLKVSNRLAKEVNNDDHADGDDNADTDSDPNADDDDVYWMSSWCRFPVYESDFGWGKPTFVCTKQSYKNVVILMDTRCGGGIEAWVSLVEDDMAIFERNPNLLQFVSTIN